MIDDVCMTVKLYQYVLRIFQVKREYKSELYGKVFNNMLMTW